MSGDAGDAHARAPIPPTLTHPGAFAFWMAVVLTGVGTGVGAIALTKLLEVVQRAVWQGDGLVDAAGSRASPWRHLLALLAAGTLTGLAQLGLRRRSAGNSIDTTAAIAFNAGRLPPLRTLGTAVLSVVIVGMGVSLGREAAPKQAGAVLANVLSDRGALSDDQRRLLVACGAGAGMAAAYGVPLGGALFALEVMRGTFALRMVLPALVTSLVATGVGWLGLPNVPVYEIPAFETSTSVIAWTLVAGPVLGVLSVGFVRAIAWADRHRPKVPWQRFLAPIVALTLLGAVTIRFPELLGNGKGIAERLFADGMTPGLIIALILLKPIATVLCLGSGAPGGLFTPTLALGALVGAALGRAWTLAWPGVPPGLFALLGAAALIAATTQGPISAAVLMMELTGRDRSFILPLLLSVATATIVARTIEIRSIYDARLSDEQVEARRRPDALRSLSGESG